MQARTCSVCGTSFILSDPRRPAQTCSRSCRAVLREAGKRERAIGKPKKPCAIDSCDRPSRQRGWCSAHYWRWWRTGNVSPDVPIETRPVEERVWANVDRLGRGAGECWPWIGATDVNGYGHSGKYLAHRRVFYLVHGYWPPCVRHACDNPPCCNPAHLLGGTLADNMRDREERGRTARGTRFPNAKLDDEKVRAIRDRNAAGETQASLAAEMGLNISTVWMVVTRRSWTHVA